MKKYLINIIILLALNSCGAGISDEVDDLGAGYQLVLEGGNMSYLLFDGVGPEHDIPPTILTYSNTDDFIIAIQHPILRRDIIYPGCDYNYANGDQEVYYWIIEKKKHITHGPLDMLEYRELRKQLNIPNDMKFQMT